MTRLPALGVVVVAAILYLSRLGYVPPYLMHDEVNFSLQAHAIATTGRDTNGRLLPVYFSETGFEAGRDPLMIYWTALFLVVQPLSEVSVRWPTAALAVLTIALMWLFVGRWRPSGPGDLVAAMLLALTPGYFTNARLALSITYGIPLAVMWLWCAHRALSGRGSWWAFAAGVCLGLGVYSYLANAILMPVFLLASCVMFWRQQQPGNAGFAAVGFVLLLVPLAGWLAFHPDRFTSIVDSYAPSGGAAIGMRDRLTAFWMFFNPDYLFVTGDGRLTNSTRAAGLFPIVFIMLMPLGLVRLAKGDGGPVGWLIVIGFAVSPLATAVSGRLEINRVLTAIPFGVLAAAAAIAHLLSGGTLRRLVAFACIAAVLVQFVGFYRNYVGPYRIASAPWFGGDNATAVNAVLDRAETSTRIYLDRGTPIERYWRFYAAARGRTDLAEAPIYYDPLQPVSEDAPAGTLIACESVHDACRDVERSPKWKLIASAALPGGGVTHEVYRRDP